jgi:hypothetical protein
MNSLSLLNFTLYQKENSYPEFSFQGSIGNITITCELNQYSRKISLTVWFSKSYVITFFSRNYDKQLSTSEIQYFIDENFNDILSSLNREIEFYLHPQKDLIEIKNNIDKVIILI